MGTELLVGSDLLVFPGKRTRRPDRALGRLDEWNFVDTLVRNVGSGGSTVPKGSSIYLRGWALLPEPPRICRMVIGSIGSRLVFETLYGKPRPDIASYYGGPELASCGFSIVQKLSGLEAGKHVLTIAALDFEDGYYDVETLPFEVVPSRELVKEKIRASTSRIHVAIDDVATIRDPAAYDGKTIRARAGDVVYVRGWAIDREARAGLSGVMGVLDDDEFVLGVHGLPRDDAASALSVPRARLCGFTVRMPTEGMRAGNHTVDVAVVSADGQSYVMHRVAKLELRG